MADPVVHPFDESLAEEATALLKALAHPARLKLCCQLRHAEHSVGDLEARLDIRQPRLSRELAKLREEGLVTTRRQSKAVYYRLSDAPRIAAMVDAICAVMQGETRPLLPVAATQPLAPRPNRAGGYGVFARPIVSTPNPT